MNLSIIRYNTQSKNSSRKCLEFQKTRIIMSMLLHFEDDSKHLSHTNEIK